GGNFNAALSADNQVYEPDYKRPGGVAFTGPVFGGSGVSGVAEPGTQTMTELMEAAGFASPASYEKTPASGFDWEGQVAFQPEDSDWVLKAGIRYGRSGRSQLAHESEIAGTRTKFHLFGHI